MGHFKPANILITPPSPTNEQSSPLGTPKIIDFGIACAEHLELLLTVIPSQHAYAPGTIRYMSPEQCGGTGYALDERSDVYSLGIVLYELLTGVLPYGESAETLADSTRAICEERPMPPNEINPATRGDLQTIVLAALEKSATRRYQSAQAFAEDIRRYLAREPIRAKPLSRWQRTIQRVEAHPLISTGCACAAIAAVVLMLTFASVWYLGRRPHAIDITPDGHAARLVSIAGHTLHTWESHADSEISSAKIIRVPPELGGHRIALLGYSSRHQDNDSAALLAFNVDQHDREPLWVGRLEEDDMPDRVRARGLRPDEFNVQHIAVYEIFPEHPGPQLVVIHRHSPFSPTAIRVYDLSGEVLYQAWHDGHLRSSYWMSEPRLLVFAGLNSLEYWEARHREAPHEVSATIRSPHPHIVFAIQPEYRARTSMWICPDRADEHAIDPAWYRCLLPPGSGDHIASHKLRAPYTGDHLERRVAWWMQTRHDPQSAIHFVLNDQGEELTELRLANDHYVRHPDAPDPNTLSIGELPPLRRTSADQPRTSPAPEEGK